jgi:hypothetical protein
MKNDIMEIKSILRMILDNGTKWNKTWNGW